ncbi:MAG: hypothetical protein LBL92_03285 [Propionibacteriaceae bacterium]|jgi:hypothetical protein|nr:hypothetical protein [Propionibacteriaceae bacterium]
MNSPPLDNPGEPNERETCTQRDAGDPLASGEVSPIVVPESVVFSGNQGHAITTRPESSPFDLRDGRAMVSLGALSEDRYCPYSCPFCYVTSAFLPYPKLPIRKIVGWLKDHKNLFDIVYISGDTDSFVGGRADDAFRLMEEILPLGVDLMFTTRWVFTERQLERLGKITASYIKAGHNVFGCVSIAQWTKPYLEPSPIKPARERAEQLRRFREIGLVSILALRPFIPTVPMSDYTSILEACGRYAHVILGEHWYVDPAGKLKERVWELEETDFSQPESVSVTRGRMPFDSNDAVWHIYHDNAKEDLVRDWCSSHDRFFAMRSREAVRWARDNVTGRNVAMTPDFINLVGSYLELESAYHTRDFGGSSSQGRSFPLDPIADARSESIRSFIDKTPSFLPALRTALAGDQGQTVIDSAAGWGELDYFRHNVLSLFDQSGSQTENVPESRRLRGRLSKPIEEALGGCKTMSQAMDLLWEVFSMLSRPDQVSLLIRDTRRMRASSLAEHLARVLEEHRSELLRHGDFEGKEHASLFTWDTPRDSPTYPARYYPFEEIRILIDNLTTASTPLVPESSLGYLAENLPRVLARVREELVSPKDALFSDDALPDVIAEADTIHAFGLTVTFVVWFLSVGNNEDELRLLRKSALFCSRSLLYDRRYLACSEFSRAVLPIIEHVAGQVGHEGSRAGTYMMTANMLFARQQLHENVTADIKAWDVTNAAKRYHLLKAVMLGETSDAAVLAYELLTERGLNGLCDLSVEEFKDWPILRRFAASDTGLQVSEAAESAHGYP